jgi:crotonobetainyl-CoA:carnitine CoA-transferase CaiB-like acyl-CoA transferase
MAGAFATMLFADYGAEVIKVERPGGDVARRAGALRTWDRGKRSIVLDLADPADGAVLARLAADADVVLAGFRPGRLETLGISEAACRQANPGLVWCDLSGYGSTPDGPGHEGFEVLAAARLGVMAESPGHRDGPIFPGHPAVAYGTGFVVAIGTLAALRARLVTGLGDRVEVSFVDGVLASMGMNWWSERNLSFVAAKTRTGGLDMGRRRMLLRRYECSDGVLVQVHTGAAGAFGRAMKAFGLDGVISPADGPIETASELTDGDLEILADRLPPLFRSKPARYWMERLWAHEVACLPLQAPGLVFDDEQIRHAGVMTAVDDPELGPIEIVGAVIRFSDSPGGVRGPAPVLDADGESVRRDGWASPGLDGVVPTGSHGGPPDAPLAGVRIVEFSNWFASPYGNRILSDLGADVVKVEAVQGDPIRPLPDPCEGANRGKRSLAIDLKAEAARDVLTRLIAQADVVQHNLRPGAAERLGIEYESARSANPRVVYGYAPGYGSSGPKARLQSFAPLLSGFVGLNHIAAGEGNEPHSSFGNEDYYNGLLSATALLLALVHRERTGRGQYVESPQVHSSVITTSEWFLRDGVPVSALPVLDHEQMGWGPTWRVYQCLSGWLAVACASEAQTAALRSATGVPPSADADPEALAAALTDAFFGAPAADWIGRLRGKGVPCEVVREDAWLAEFLLDDDNVKAGRSLEIEHPLHGRARAIGALVHLRDRPVPAGGRSPLLGEHSADVVRELGFGESEVAQLLADGTLRMTPVP